MLQAVSMYNPLAAMPRAAFPFQNQECGLEYGSSSSSCESFVCVSTERPYKLLDVSQEWLDLFQFSREEVSGRALRLISGPATNLNALSGLIDRAKDGKEGQGTIFLYSSSGVGKLVSVRAFASPISSDACVIEMRQSEAISVPDPKVADEMPNFGGADASVLVSAEEPYTIERLNERFSLTFGCGSEMTIGRSLRLIYGPRTNAKDFSTILKNARAGFSRCTTLNLYTTRCEEIECSVRAVPVADCGGNLSKILVKFALPEILHHSERKHCEEDVASSMLVRPSNQDSYERYPAALSQVTSQPIPEESELESLTTSMESRLAIGRMQHAPPPLHFVDNVACPPGPRPMAAAWDETMPSSPAPYGSYPSAPCPPSSSTNPSGQSSPCPEAPCSRLSRRNSVDSTVTLQRPASNGSDSGGSSEACLKLIPRKKGTVSSPVQLSVQLLKDMGVMSMRKAAEELGIAPSTLKKACRRLGMKRWIHSPSAAPIQQHAMDYNSAYVRSLHTKYAPKRPTPNPTSPDSETGWDAHTPDWSTVEVHHHHALGLHDRQPPQHGGEGGELASLAPAQWPGHSGMPDPGGEGGGWQVGVGVGGTDWEAGWGTDWERQQLPASMHVGMGGCFAGVELGVGRPVC